MSYTKELELHRTDKDQFFKSHHQSPIPHDRQKSFTGLNYYPIDESMRFELPLQAYDDPETVEMEDTTGGTRFYSKIGYLQFQVDGEEASLQVYQSDNGYYFVPFRDATSDTETYGAGRYLDVERRDDLFILDFNLAYNPYCAYNDNYSCPLPPFDNWLQVSIRAGEKEFEH